MSVAIARARAWWPEVAFRQLKRNIFGGHIPQYKRFNNPHSYTLATKPSLILISCKRPLLCSSTVSSYHCKIYYVFYHRYAYQRGRCRCGRPQAAGELRALHCHPAPESTRKCTDPPVASEAPRNPETQSLQAPLTISLDNDTIEPTRFVERACTRTTGSGATTRYLDSCSVSLLASCCILSATCCTTNNSHTNAS